MLTPPNQRHGCSSSYFLEVGGGALILRHRQPIYKCNKYQEIYVSEFINNGSPKFFRRQKQPLEVDRRFDMKNNRKKAKPIGDYPLYWQVFLLTLIVLYGSSFVLLLMGLISV